jgi:threonine synthase
VVAVGGTYDEVNRLCSELADRYRWAFVNVNIRPYYTEGSKTLAFEIVEQLGWECPDHLVVPVASGALLTKTWRGLEELLAVGLVDKVTSRIHGAQAEGCSPVATAFKQGAEDFTPVRPRTIARSLAIGNPADGFYALRCIRQSGGTAESVTDDELIEGILLLSRTEGIFAETAGGVTVAVAKKLAQAGAIGRKERTVLLITGGGLKTQEVVSYRLAKPFAIQPSLKSFEETVGASLHSR